jgi:CBS domain-containing protein
MRDGAIKELAQTPASELAVKSRELVKINTSTTVDEALNILKRHNILSLPVYNEVTKEFIGIANMIDILRYVAFFDFKDGKVAESFQNGTISCASLLSLDQESQGLWIASVTDSLDDLLEYFSKGVHRILVRLPATSDESESEIRLVTQTDIVRFLCSNVNEIKKQVHLIDRSVKEIGLIKGVKTIPETETALSGFALMAQEGLGSIPVVDKDGVLKATLSASDLRGLTSNLIQRVLFPIETFFKESRRGYVPKPVWIQENNTLGEAMNLMIIGHVHQVWIVNGMTFKPIGVVTMSDVIREIYANRMIPLTKPPI